MERYLREWRDNAASKDAYDTAIFVGDKILDLSGKDEDAIRMAHLHYQAGNNFKAHSVLERYDLIKRFTACRLLAGRCLVKLSKYDDALEVLGEHPPSHLLQHSDHSRKKQNRGTNISRTGSKHAKANSNLTSKSNGDSTDPFLDERSQRRDEAAICYLRGICCAKSNAFDRAKECYKDAVRIDVQCFEALDALVKNSLMEPVEEGEFLNSLNFDSVTSSPSGNNNDPSKDQEAAELTRMLYKTRLSKYNNTSDLTSAIESLSTHYNLSSNADILLSKAELLFTECRFRDALALTDRVLERDRYCFSALPVHLACLHELGEKNALFLLAHDFTDHHPEEPSTWLAVGVYYLTIGNIAQARRFFSKSSMMDPHFGPAWIGFAHTFAAEGEHDQANSAYATAARLFQGTHLPALFLGMQNLQLQHQSFAREYLNSAYNMCQTDPLVLNELGVVHYQESSYEQAAFAFHRALSLAAETGAEPSAWLSTRVNLGHCMRKMGKWEDAIEEFDEVLRLGGRDAGILSAKGICLMDLQRTNEAVSVLNEALAISPQDVIAGELMARALGGTAKALRLAGDDTTADRGGARATQKPAVGDGVRKDSHQDQIGRILDDEADELIRKAVGRSRDKGKRRVVEGQDQAD